MTRPIPTHSSLRAVSNVPGYKPRALASVVMGVEVVAGTDMTSPECLLYPTVQVGACVNPMLDNYLRRLGAKKVDKRTYHLPLVTNQEVEAATDALRAVRTQALCTSTDVTKAKTKEVSPGKLRRREVEENVDAELSRSPRLHAAYTALESTTRSRRDGSRSWVVIKVTKATLQLKVITHDVHHALENSDRYQDLDTLRWGHLGEGLTMYADEVIEVIDNVNTDELGLVDVGREGRWADLVDLSSSSLVVREVPGAPGLAELSCGAGVEVEVHSHVRRTSEALAVAGAHHLEVPVAVGERVVELAEMSLAGHTQRLGLLPHQDQFCSVYAAARRGVVNAMEPGMGKTVSSAAAMRERATEKEGWRGLVVVPAGLREQWREELKRFFPETLTHLITNLKDVSGTPGALSDAGKRPLCVIISHEALARSKDDLTIYHWDDLVCDEAALLRSRTSNRSKALWEVRAHARRAIALTGTPVEKDMHELSNLAAWALGDTLVQDASEVASQHDMTLNDALGGSVFRRTLTEITGELPDVTVQEMLVKPGASHALLLRHLHGAFRTEVLAMHDDQEAGRRSDAARRRARAHNMLITLRAASTDPRALVGSEASVVKNLPKGVLLNALKEDGKKTAYVLELARGRVAEGGRLLVCTDFPNAAKALSEACQGAGISSMVLSGSQSTTERTMVAAAFTEGEVQVLCLSGAGRLGLNLQAATDIIHLDLPTSTTQLTQRTARAVRIGSKHKELLVHVPVLQDSVDTFLVREQADVLGRIERPDVEELEEGIKNITSDTKLYDLANTLPVESP